MLKKLLKKHIILIVILLVASFLRLYRIGDYMEFLGDQGRDVVIIRNFLKTGNLFFIGPQTSIGDMYLGPYYYYLIAPSLLLANFNPIGPAIFIALLGILTTALIFFIVKKWFGSRPAYFSAFLFAISPVVIKYSNFSWNPNIMPLFALLFIYFIGEAVFKYKYRNFIYAILAFIMAINAHYLALILLPTAGIFWLVGLVDIIKHDKSKIKSFVINTIIAAFVFIVSLTPQILFDIKHHGQNINALIKFFTYRETTVNIKAYKAVPNLFPLFDQVNTRLLAGKYDNFGLYVSIFFFISLVFSFFLIRSKAKKQLKYFILLALWYLDGLIGLGLYKQHIYDHYFAFLFPVVFMLAGVAIDKLMSYKKLTFILGLVFLSTLSALSITANQFKYEPPKQLTTTREIVNLINKDANNQPFNLALLAKMNYDPPYRYFLYENKAPVFDLHDKITDQLYVICEPFQMNCDPINNPLWEIAAFGWSKVDKQWQINDIKIFRLVHTK